MKNLAMILALALMLSAVPLMAQTDTSTPPADESTASDPIPVDPGSEPADEPAPPAVEAN